MSRWAKGTYEIVNPQKYVGKGKPTYRSGWEHSFMRFCDLNEHILQWASEAIHVNYRNPFTNKKQLINICGHYVLSTDNFINQIKKNVRFDIDNIIKDNIKVKLKELYGKN